ncbi:MAG: pyruvate ferredoxin oxidoreductase, partial [Vicinamibacteria bacterium]
MKLWSKTRPEAVVAKPPRFPGVRAVKDAVSAASLTGGPSEALIAGGTLAATSLAGERVTHFVSGPDVAAMHTSMAACAGRRLTLVLNLAARALTRQARSSHAGHDGYHAVEDAGFFQLFARDVQQSADFNLIAHRIAEMSLNPGLVAQDGSLGPHAVESLLCPEADLVTAYLGEPADRIECPTRAQRLVFGETRRRIPEMFDLDYPTSQGGTQNQDSYAQGVAAQRPFYLDHIAEIADEAFGDFALLTGRRYARASGHRLEDAEWVIVGQGSVVSDAEAVADHLRSDRGLKVGVLNLAMFRPFPSDLVTAMLAGKKGVLVLERVDQPLAVDPPVLRELRAAMSRGLENGRHSMSHPGLFALRSSDVPEFYAACYGLGGRDLQPGDIVAAVDNMRRDGDGPRHVYLGLDFVRPGTRLPKLQIWQETLVERYPQLKSLALPGSGDIGLLPKDAIAIRLHSTVRREGADPGHAIALAAFEVFGLHVKAWPRQASGKVGQPQTSFVLLGPTPMVSNAEPRHFDVVLASDPNVFRHTDPLAGLVDGGALIVETSLSSDAFWSMLPVKARRSLIDRRIRVLSLNPGLPEPEAGAALIGAFLSLAPWRSAERDIDDTSFQRASLALAGLMSGPALDLERSLRRGFNDVRDVAQPSGEAVEMKGDVPRMPVLIESPRAQPGPGHEGRFWEQVLSVRELGQDGIADPFAAIGAIPAATAAVRDMSRTRIEVPEFNGAKCTGCAECWTQCPDAAIPGLVSSVEDVLSSAIDAAGEGQALE